MKLTILGTGSALVTECYNTCFVLTNENKEHFLVDGGGGNMILHQIKYAGIDWKEIKHIFVTHKHVDHLMGIIWMVRMITQSMSQDQYDGDAYIYTHDEVADLIQDMSMKLLQPKQAAFLGKRLHLVVICDKEKKQIIGKTITFFDIQSTKAKQFGFCIMLNDIEKLTCCGDEPYNESEKDYVKDSKWLLHEAFCLHSQADIFKPYEKHHSTVKDACELAESMNVSNLLLYHTEDKTIHDRQRLYMEEGHQYYQGNLYVPNDLDILEL